MNGEMPKIKKETKNKIHVEFEDRTPLKERLKIKYGSKTFWLNLLVKLVRLVFLVGISYIILFPFFSKISSSFWSPKDFIQPDVKLIPKYPTLDTYKYIITENGYIQALLNTLWISAVCAVLQTLVCAFVGYGFAKFKFKGRNILFFLLLITMIVPHQILRFPMKMQFTYPQILGINSSPLWKAIGLQTGFMNSIIPVILLSLTGLAFKNGLFIFVMRQFYLGVPDELEESAYIDGSDVVKTFFRVIVPLSVPMMITIFLLSFSWQWTDTFYCDTFLGTSNINVLSDIVFKVPPTLETMSSQAGANANFYTEAIHNTSGLLAITPLLILYLFCQRYLIQGIERTGIVG